MVYKNKKLTKFKGKSSAKFNDLSNKTFGNWYVICRAPTIKKATTFWCECSCGSIKQVYSTHLVRGYSKGCLKCSTQKLSKGKVKTIGDIPESFWKEFMRKASGEKSRASRRNLKFNLTLEDAWALYQKQDGKCALTGLKIGFCVDCSLDKFGYKKRWIHTASMDRIDSSGDYELNNIQWVHKDVNRMKNIYNQDYFINICNKIVEISKRKEVLCQTLNC